ncbi:hypothetical protein [Chitinophaga sp. CF418]|uniref:hypothetical protein n=1 Tax=Chitinophaga sp. CF418 TaxID=1855287 RepID=UPI00166002A8|nr:hypothetical protein [Chitinophaga sp. CF418]
MSASRNAWRSVTFIEVQKLCKEMLMMVARYCLQTDIRFAYEVKGMARDGM